MLISSDGTIIRLRINEISILGRVTQGVTLMRMKDGVNVVGIASMINEETEETDEGIDGALETDDVEEGKLAEGDVVD